MSIHLHVAYGCFCCKWQDLKQLLFDSFQKTLWTSDLDPCCSVLALLTFCARSFFLWDSDRCIVGYLTAFPGLYPPDTSSVRPTVVIQHPQGRTTGLFMFFFPGLRFQTFMIFCTYFNGSGQYIFDYYFYRIYSPIFMETNKLLCHVLFPVSFNAFDSLL